MTDREAGLLYSRIWRGLTYFPERMEHNLDVICPRNFTALCVLSLLRWAVPIQARQTRWRKNRWAHCQDLDHAERRP